MKSQLSENRETNTYFKPKNYNSRMIKDHFITKELRSKLETLRNELEVKERQERKNKKGKTQKRKDNKPKWQGKYTTAKVVLR